MSMRDAINVTDSRAILSMDIELHGGSMLWHLYNDMGSMFFWLTRSIHTLIQASAFPVPWNGASEVLCQRPPEVLRDPGICGCDSARSSANLQGHPSKGV